MISALSGSDGAFAILQDTLLVLMSPLYRQADVADPSVQAHGEAAYGAH